MISSSLGGLAPPLEHPFPPASRLRRHLQFSRGARVRLTAMSFSPAIGPKTEWGAQVILVESLVVVWMAIDHTQLSKKERADIDASLQDGAGNYTTDILRL